jgi:exonuclease SbcD
MITIVATSDLHIDGGKWGGRNPDTGRLRAVESTYAIWMDICRRAVTEKAVLVLAGDLFFDGHPRPEHVEMIADGLRLVTGSGGEVVVIRGNHDPKHLPFGERDPLSRYADIAGVHVVLAPRIVRLSLGLSVVGLPWPSAYDYLEPGEAEGLSLDEIDLLVAARATNALEDLVDEASGFGDPVVVATHCTVDAAMLSSPRRGSEVVLGKLLHEPVLSLESFDRDPIALAIAGHIHRGQRLGERFYYCGGPDRFDFGEEDQEKGYLLARVDDTGVAVVERIPTAARRFVTVELDATTSLETLGFAPGEIVRVRLGHDATLSESEIRRQIVAAGGELATIVKLPAPAVERSRHALEESVGELDGLRHWLELAGEGGPDSLDELLAEAELLIDDATSDGGVR